MITLKMLLTQQMRRLTYVLLFLCMVCGTSVYAQTGLALEQEKLAQLWPCDGRPHDFLWRSPAYAIRVHSVIIGIGASGAVAPNPWPVMDLYTNLFATHKHNFVLHGFGIDRYAPTSMIQQSEKVFHAPFVLVVPANTDFVMQGFCAEYAGVPNTYILSSAWIWYAREP